MKQSKFYWRKEIDNGDRYTYLTRLETINIHAIKIPIDNILYFSIEALRVNQVHFKTINNSKFQKEQISFYKNPFIAYSSTIVLKVYNKIYQIILKLMEYRKSCY